MKFISLLFLIFLPLAICAQTDPFDYEKLFSPNEDEEKGNEDLNAFILDILNSKSDMNEITREFFTGLSFITPEQVDNFFQYKEKSGEFLSVYELQNLPGWDIKICRSFSSLIEVNTPNRRLFSHLFSTGEIIVRQETNLQKKKGFSDLQNPFDGNGGHWSIRIKTNKANDYSISIATEKDAGENLKWKFPGQLGFDHWSGNITLMKKGIVDKLVLGDYRLQFGQGLVHGGAFGGGKSSETINSVRRPNSGIIPASSFAEYGFLRGTAITLKKKSISLTAYASFKGRDASVKMDSSINSDYITSFLENGLHRTFSEIEKRNAVKETVLGSALVYTGNHYTIGTQYMFEKFSVPIAISDEPYKVHGFHGKTNNLGSIFFNAGWQNIYFFSEAAMSKGPGVGFLSGAIVNITRDLDLAFLYRHLTPEYHSFHAKVFAESSSFNNEKGAYWGLKWQFHRKWIFSSYFDYFLFPWLKYQVDQPTDGNEILLRLDRVSKRAPFYIQLKREIKDSGTPVGQLDFGKKENRKLNIQFNFQYQISDNLTGSIRLVRTFSSINNEKARGHLLKQDLKYSFRWLTISAGYFFFDVNYFDAAIYLSEPDVRYSSTFSSFNGNGLRYYGIFKFKIKRHLNLWIKYNLTNYTDRNEIGSGSDLIEGNKISTIKTQIIYSFN